MSAATMAKKAGRPKGDRDDVTVRIPRAMASRAKAVAEWRGVTVAEVLEELISAPLARAFGEMVRELNPPE